MQKVDKDINYFTDDNNLIQEYNRLKKVLKKKDKANVYLFEDEEEGYPERKFITAEVQRPFPDGIVFISYANTIEEIIQNITDYLNY